MSYERQDYEHSRQPLFLDASSKRTVWEPVQNTSQEAFRNLADELGVVVLRTFTAFASFGPRKGKNVLPV
jgi:hypothetical protein